MKTNSYYFSSKWILLTAFQSIFTGVFSQDVITIPYDYSKVGATSFSDNYVYEDGYEIADVTKIDEAILNINVLTGIKELVVGTDYEIQFGVTNPTHKVGRFLPIENSCSCIMTDWEKNPIPPGRTGFIKIKYTARIPGPDEKRFNVYLFDSNGLKPMAIAGVKITAVVAQIPDSK